MTAVDPAKTPPSWALIDAQAQRLRDRRPEDVYVRCWRVAVVGDDFSAGFW
ncbi:hypothetical protein [Brevundimonas naejangsanensis]|uniref:hypothetical protein n=1 Tax=Brevundimonas naejangsanensis TaxID=588932 RepID=UPI0014254FA5|nr:hypothetical protein [Brevundimonas naejangsanensis]